MVRTRGGKDKRMVVREKSSERGEPGDGEEEGVGRNLLEEMEKAGDPIPQLPKLLLDPRNLPKRCRLNIYSKPEIIGLIADLLEGTREWDQLMASQFGKLFRLPVSRCAHSAKLIHGLLSRQLITTKQHEMWCVYAGKPLRFSIREFGIVTGLKCGQFPSDDEILEQRSVGQSVWKRLFKENPPITVQRVLDLLQDNEGVEDAEKMSPWAKFAMCLIVLVDGVIVCNNKYHRITTDYVEMLNNIEFFLNYPWGRASFTETLNRFGLPKDSAEPITDLKMRLFQKTSACYGFPLSIQLQAFESIPLLLAKVPQAGDLRDFVERRYEKLNTVKMITKDEMMNVEKEKQVSVSHTLFNGNPMLETDFVWTDEVEDPQVAHMIKLIDAGHVFKPSDWPVCVSDKHNIEKSQGDEGDEEVEDVTNVVDGKHKRKPVTRSDKQKKEAEKTRGGSRAVKAIPTQYVGRERAKVGDAENISPDAVEEIKKFIVTENIKLRKEIVAEVAKLIKGEGQRAKQSKVQQETGVDLRRSKRTNPPTCIPEKEEVTPKRRKTTDGGNLEDKVVSLSSETTSQKKNEHEEGPDNREEDEEWETTGEVEKYPSVQGLVDRLTEEVGQSAMDGGRGIPEEVEEDSLANIGGATECMEGAGGDQRSGLQSPIDGDTAKTGDNSRTAEGVHGMESIQVFDGEDPKFMEEPEGATEDGGEVVLSIQGEEQPNTQKVEVDVVHAETCKSMKKRVPIRSHYLDSQHYASDVRLKALFASRSKKPAYSPNPQIDDGDFDTFRVLMEENIDEPYKIVTKHTVTNRSFLHIAELGRPFTTESMQLVMGMMWRKRGGTYLEERKAIIEPWFTTLLQSKYEDFKNCKDKDNFSWGLDVKLYVSGRSTCKLLKTEFLKNVDAVYVPMEWPNKHWVGVIIDLKVYTLTIVDPLPKQKKMPYDRLIAPITQSLPRILKQYGLAEGRNAKVKELGWRRVTGLYSNTCVGDSGPIAAKFLELHAYHGGYTEMGNLTNSDVEKIRKSYAIDAFGEFAETAAPI